MPHTPAPAPAQPDLRGRTAVVTGASDGVGVEIARGLAAAGAEVVLPVRDRAKGERAIARIRETVPDARLSLRDLDLARLASVRTLVADLAAEDASIDLLVLNAGVVLLGDRARYETEDGCELHLQTNFLGHAVLTLGLLPLLRARRGRVVVQSSLAAAVARVRWDDLPLRRRYGPLRAYGASKVLLGAFGFELARRSVAEGWGVTMKAGHPGIAAGTAIAPPIRALVPASAAHAFARWVGNSPQRAAQPALRAAVADAAASDFFAPAGLLQIGGPAIARRPFRRIADPVTGTRAWQITERFLATGRGSLRG